MTRKIESIVKKNSKPRVRFCHDCSKKLYGNHHTEVRFKNIDHTFIYHKDCADKLKKDYERGEEI